MTERTAPEPALKPDERKCNYPDCDGGPATGYCHVDCRVADEDHLDDCVVTMICPVTGQPCMTEHDEHCEDYGCARKAGIDVNGKARAALEPKP